LTYSSASSEELGKTWLQRRTPFQEPAQEEPEEPAKEEPATEEPALEEPEKPATQEPAKEEPAKKEPAAGDRLEDPRVRRITSRDNLAD
jgi:hypothetical protein